MVRSRDVVYPPEGSGTSAVETWFNRLNQRLQALAMTSGNAWEPGGRDTPRPDMYQLYRAADRTSPPAPVIAQAGCTRGLKLIVRPSAVLRASTSALPYERPMTKTMRSARCPSRSPPECRPDARADHGGGGEQ